MEVSPNTIRNKYIKLEVATTGSFTTDCENAVAKAALNAYRCAACRTNDHTHADCPRFNINFMRQSGLPICTNCGDWFHKAKDCTEPAPCKCGSFDHEYKKYSLRITCNTCHNTGHIAFACPEKPCFRCKRTGHIAANCNVCSDCGEIGHYAQDAACTKFKRRCKRCGSLDHQT